MTSLVVARLPVDAKAGAGDVARLDGVFFEILGAAATSQFRDDDGGWVLSAFFEKRPDAGIVDELLAPVFRAIGQLPTSPEFDTVKEKDWLAASRKAFPPIEVGRFWIAGEHVRAPAPAASVALRIGAGQAFGTGLHPTTQGCLHALAMILMRFRSRRARVLDMGCGSAILLVAALAARGGFSGLAVDNDAIAVDIARQNARVNMISPVRLRAVTANGYASRAVRRGAPYGLVFANILARPLCRMAAAQVRAMAPGGWLVLSGILDSQAPWVERCYRARGARLAGRVRIAGWTTLVLSKGRGGQCADGQGRGGQSRGGGMRAGWFRAGTPATTNH